MLGHLRNSFIFIQLNNKVYSQSNQPEMSMSQIFDGQSDTFHLRFPAKLQRGKKYFRKIMTAS